MREKASIIAQRLLNLYRQAHVISGGWVAVNGAFLAEANADVLEELIKLPNGEKLAAHIKNLKSGKTPADGIERELMPYGGLMDRAVALGDNVSSNDLKELEKALAEFQPDEASIDKIKNLAVVQSFGENWIKGISAALVGHADLLDKWRRAVQTSNAYELWNRAYSILTPPVSDRARAEIQADLSEYETYLPMFGEDGQILLEKLRTFISSV